MNDIIDDMVNGDICQNCEQETARGNGHPVTCPECDESDPNPVYAPLSKTEKRRYKRNRKSERYRVMHSIIKRGASTLGDLLENNPPDGLERIQNLKKEMDGVMARIDINHE